MSNGPILCGSLLSTLDIWAKFWFKSCYVSHCCCWETGFEDHMVCWLSLQKQANSLNLLWFVIVICRPSLDRALNPMDTAQWHQLCAPRYRPIVRYRILIPTNIIGSGFQWINILWTWIERVYNNNLISQKLCVEIRTNTAHGFDKLSTGINSHLLKIDVTSKS